MFKRIKHGFNLTIPIFNLGVIYLGRNRLYDAYLFYIRFRKSHVITINKWEGLPLEFKLFNCQTHYIGDKG